MSQYAIQVEHLSKSYQIRQGERAGYTALRDVLSERTGRFFGRLAKGKNPFQGEETNEEFWALDDVSFNVEHGEVLGIIGRNGAGKSTLLKLLSRITEPDKGKITLNGRVASLLEVGTGFHPELTGRENIYLSGAILGMRREEIRKRFDEIVDFAGVEKFLDTPVKRYSSGMYVRLGFAVAAHLETEILLVDEVLAVGDMDFQRRCIGKMGEACNNGKAVVLVSHNLTVVGNLCLCAILLNRGSIEFYGSTNSTIERYLNFGNTHLESWINLSANKNCINNEYYKLNKFELLRLDGELLNESLFIGDDFIDVHIALYVTKPDENLCIGFLIRDTRGNHFVFSFQTDSNLYILDIGEHDFFARVNISYLIEGHYYVDFIAGIHGVKMLANENEGVFCSFSINGIRNMSLMNTRKRNVLTEPKVCWKISSKI